MNLAMLNEISDETKLVRFVDKRGMLFSVGSQISGDKIQCSFPLQLLSHFKKCEGNANDSSEGSTVIDFGAGKGSGRITTCNNALISCWSIYDGAADPWASLFGSSFAGDPARYPYAIVSSVARVKEQVKVIMDEINHVHKDDGGRLLLNAVYGPVSYYSRAGLSQSEWEEKVNQKFGVDIPTILNIFHKPEYSVAGTWYRAERECRFALILNMRKYKQRDGKLLHANDIAGNLIYYSLAVDCQVHYLDKIYFMDNEGKCHELLIVDVMAIEGLVQNA